MISFIERIKGKGHLPPKIKLNDMLLASLGGFIAILVISGLMFYCKQPLLLGSFGASCVLLFGYPDAPFSQPRNAFFGHLISSCVGLACLYIFGPVWWSVAIAVALAIFLMMFTRTVHPPAGSNPVIVFLTHPAFSFAWAPTAIGAFILVVCAVLFNAAARKRTYPVYW